MPKRRTTAKKTARQGKTTDYLVKLALDSSLLDTDILIPQMIPAMRSFFLLKQEYTNGHYVIKHQMDAVLGCYGPFNIELLQTFIMNQLSEEEYFQKKELASDTTFRNEFMNMLLDSIPDDPTLNQNERLSVALLKILFKQRVDNLTKQLKENTPCLGKHPLYPEWSLHTLPLGEYSP
jgi:hypothetical protein